MISSFFILALRLILDVVCFCEMCVKGKKERDTTLTLGDGGGGGLGGAMAARGEGKALGS